MRIQKAFSIRGRDFSADMVCEHCNAESKLTTGYDDGHYHSRVIPAMHCKACGLNRAGEERTEEVIAAAHAAGVNGV